MKKLFTVIIALMLCCLPSYAQIWEGGGGSMIEEGLGFGDGEGGIDWSDFDGETCTVTFRDIDNTYSQSAVVPVGIPSGYILDSLTLPSPTGYDFLGWSTLANYPSLITMPVTFTATETYYTVYTPHKHSVTYMIDNSVYYVAQNVPYGTSSIPLPPEPEYPDIPQGDALYYWNGMPSTMPDNDVTVTAVYGVAYWGMDINQSTGEITYLYRAQNMLPVRVSCTSNNTPSTISNWDDSATSWKSFVYKYARPCMLKSDGTVDYYLNREDQRYKEDGVTASDYNQTTYDGNAMVEFQKLYIKITEPETDVIRVLISPVKVDNTFTAYAFTDSNGNEVDRVYYGMFLGTNSNSKIRSIVGGSNLAISWDSYQSYAQANGTGWDIEYYSLRNYINLLTVLVMKTLDVAITGYGAEYSGGAQNGTSPTSQWGVDQGAFAVSNTKTDPTYDFKLFWIRDFFVCDHLVRGIAYDATNTCWKYRNTAPYSFSDFTTYSYCTTDSLTFKADGSGYLYAFLDRMAVKDNLLFPYREYKFPSGTQTANEPVTAYGNSLLGNFKGTTISTSSGVFPYICFGAHSLITKPDVKSYNNIWNINLGNSSNSGVATGGVSHTSLIYVPAAN